MKFTQEKLSPLFARLYTWLVTIYFGAVLLDIVYSKLVPEAAVAFSEVSDFLLCIGALTFLTAIGAVAFSWKSSAA
jgi:hypothetical protein